MVTLSTGALDPFARFTRYNSPYPAHDAGTAVDLYPDGDGAPSPVAGEVVRTRTVACPSRPYAADHDHLIVVDTGEHLARILHVYPAVEPGEAVSVGDHLGDLVRSGYFAPWVDDHVHLGFRDPEDDPVRATGSLPLSLDVPLEPVPWDGTGRVVEVGRTYAVLDAPTHPDPGDVYAGIADDSGAFVLDGGMPHYDWGGRLDPGPADRGDGPADEEAESATPIEFLGETVGIAEREPVRWTDHSVVVDGDPVTGLSFFLGRDALYAKIVEPGHAFAVGDRLTVTVDA
ncbi:MAG: hypothetical protein ABEJ76_06815 [Halanaeroarchaeum sp.]